MPSGQILEADPRPHIQIGSDTVYQEDNRLIIHATEAMDWPIREFSRVPIYVLGHKYYLRSKRAGEHPPAVVYELWPWPDHQFEKANISVIYDAAYVAERNQLAASTRRHELVYYLLLPLYPLLGLFWSDCKERLLSPIGFEPDSITRISIFLTLNLFLVQGILVAFLGGGFFKQLGLPHLWALDFILLVLFLVDPILRFSQALKLDAHRHWGFCEWCWPGAWRD